MSRLIIIGNGFDLAHGVRSSYFDFRDHLIEKNHKLYSLIVELSGENVWSNFEENLANLDLESLIDRLLDEHIPQEAYRQLLNDDRNRPGVRSIEKKLEETAQLLISDLENELVEWAVGIKDSAEEAQFKLFQEDYVISFNYTSTVENLYDIDKGRIYYIHKKAEDYYFNFDSSRPRHWQCLTSSEWRLVFGHGSRDMQRTAPPVLLPSMTSDYDINYAHQALSEAFREVYTYFDLSRKPTEEILPILDNFLVKAEAVDQVIIIGHSLASVDLDYFSKISNRFNRAMNYTITYHGGPNKEIIEERASKFLKKDDTVEFVDVSKRNALNK